ncbi:hypothetical protein TWF730_009032 [Orbilia blumenaviensis]|uniref:DUF7896 domain-containing protein n=1 Tax=Orbilia blumenaviensis TaxID=1796055 RepID=A0AAV9UZW9_9PEZI
METASTGSAHDPVRQQFLRQLHWYLGQITNEMVQEAGENYDRKKRNDKFYNSLKFLADHVVRFNDTREKGREPTVPPRSSPTGDHTGMRPFIPNSSLHKQPQQSVSAEVRPPINVALQQPDLASLHASLPRGRSFSEAQPGPGTMHGSTVINMSRPTVSPTAALDATFSSMPSLQNSRVQPSESVPTVGGISPSRSPSTTNTTRNNIQPSINQANSSSTLQNKPSTNFGFAPQRKALTSMTPLQQAAISTTAEIEASLAGAGDFLAPQRDTTLLPRQTGPMASKQSLVSHSASRAGPNATDLLDNNASQVRKRKRQKKQWCTLCNEHKEGFRGPHELARHMNIQHQTKKTVFIVYDDSPGGDMFKNCKHCSRRKIYGQDYNAACHLRRAHFNKRLKTDTPEEREYKQLHPDLPPMEELRPWLRKCLVDVSKLKDGKYIDNQDEAILKVEPAVKFEDPASSSDQDKDLEMSDNDPQPEGPATPPPDSEVEAEAPMSGVQDPTMDESIIHNNFMDFDFSDFVVPQSDFVFSPPLVQPMQPSTIPRTNNLNTIFALQMQSMGISPDQIISDKMPEFIGIDNNNMFNTPFDLPEFTGHGLEALGIDGSLENFDIDQFLAPTLN